MPLLRPAGLMPQGEEENGDVPDDGNGGPSEDQGHVKPDEEEDGGPLAAEIVQMFAEGDLWETVKKPLDNGTPGAAEVEEIFFNFLKIKYISPFRDQHEMRFLIVCFFL